jgi:hypothetical protein
LKKVEFIIKTETNKREGFIEDDNSFNGGKKITYKINGTETGIVCIDLVEWYEEQRRD